MNKNYISLLKSIIKGLNNGYDLLETRFGICLGTRFTRLMIASVRFLLIRPSVSAIVTFRKSSLSQNRTKQKIGFIRKLSLSQNRIQREISIVRKFVFITKYCSTGNWLFGIKFDSDKIDLV